MSTMNDMLAFLVTKTGGLSLAEISQFCETYGVDASTVTVTAVGGQTATTAPAKRRGRKPGRKPGRKAKAAAPVAKPGKGGKKKAPPRVNGKDHEAVAKKTKGKKEEKEALDPKAVIAAIKELKDESGWVKAETIKAKLGCDAAALRGVLNALIEDDKVKYTGKARGTQYAMA